MNNQKSRVHFNDKNLEFIRSEIDRTGLNFTLVINAIIAEANETARGAKNEYLEPSDIAKS